jgi:hypothetical protein
MAETPEDGLVELDPGRTRLTQIRKRMKDKDAVKFAKFLLTRLNDGTLRRIEPSTRNSNWTRRNAECPRFAAHVNSRPSHRQYSKTSMTACF